MSERQLAVHYKQVRITSAQLKAIVATDVELVAAPGAGKVIVPLWAILTMDYGTATYAWANSDHGITVGDMAMDNDAAAQALIEATSDFSVRLTPLAGDTVLTANSALKLTASGTGEPTTGDGTLVVKVAYHILDEDTA